MTKFFTKIMATVKRSPVETGLIAALVLVLTFVTVPMAFGATDTQGVEDKSVAMVVSAMQNQTLPYGILPTTTLRGHYYTKTVTASAYNSVPGQTDSTPFITASGTTVRHGVLAANFLPIGTLVTIPSLYGDQVFVVEDRMNVRYQNNVDIWMENIADAKQFGRRSVEIRIYTGG